MNPSEKPKTLKELADEYGVCSETMQKWINDIALFQLWRLSNPGIRKRLYKPKEVKIIYDTLG